MRRILLLGLAGLGVAGVAVLGAVAVAATAPERLAWINVAESELSVDQSVNTNRLARLLSVLQQLKRDPPPALLVSPQDARDAVRAAILVKAMTPELRDRAQAYAWGATEVMRQRRLAAVQSEALFVQDSRAADAQAPPQGGFRAGGLPIHGIAGVDEPALLTAPLRLVVPVQGAITHRFGDPIAGGGRANGLTFSAVKGARAVSPAAGLVQYVGPVKGWGVILILRLAGGYHLVLAGLERTSVQAGQSVAEGQAVGWTADERQSNSELYLEIREQGSPVDPGRWLNKKSG